MANWVAEPTWPTWQLNQLDKHLFVFSTSNPIVFAAKYFKHQDFQQNFFLSKIFAKFFSNFAKMAYRKFSQKKGIFNELLKNFWLLSKTVVQFGSNFVNFAKMAYQKVSRKWSKLFSNPIFEWLAEISRKRLNEHLETLIFSQQLNQELNMIFNLKKHNFGGRL